MPPLLLYVSCAFGLMPFNHLNLKTHLLMDYILMLIFPAIYVICFIFTFFKWNFGIFTFPECSSFCTFINRIFLQLGFFLYLSIHGFSLFRGKKFYTIFEKKLKIIDDLIEHCQHVSKYKPNKEKRIHNCGLYFVLAILGISLAYAVIYDVVNMIGLYEILFWIPIMTSSFPFIAASIVQIQFISFVSKLLKRFNNVNKIFQKIDDDCNESNKTDESLKIYDIDIQPLPKSINIFSNELITKSKLMHFPNNKPEHFTEIPSTNPTSEIILPQLFELHEKILSLCEITNKEYGPQWSSNGINLFMNLIPLYLFLIRYGPQTVPYMACCFIMSVLTIFIQAKVIIAVGVKNHFLNYAIIEMSVWTFGICSIAYIILNYCYSTNGCSKRMAITVHEIMQKKSIFMLENNFFYIKMKSFSLQYLHWENYFNFNGFGLFVLDYTFIFAVVGAGTSYLIVLLQFDMTPILKGDGLL